MNRIFVLLLFLVLISAGAGYYFLNNQIKLPVSLPQGKICDKDTMICEDGTVLKRQGLSCDFPPCPQGSTSSGVLMSAAPAPQPEGEEITVSGTIICLPHRDTSGPQTMECAFGLKSDDGNNYGLTDPEWKYLMNAGGGTEVEITGLLNRKQDQKYNSSGVITINSLRKI